MTWARTAEEATLLLESLETLSALGLPIFAGDSGSPASFIEQVERLPEFDLRQEGSGLARQIKSAMRRAMAAGHDVVLYTEPDKRDFFAGPARSYLENALQSPDNAIHIPARDEASFATFPYGQQQAERAFNQLASGFLGTLPDQLYGPMVLNTEIITPFLSQAPDDLGWGWRTYVVTRCVRARQRIGHTVGSFACPSAQRGEDDDVTRIYRLSQLKEGIEGLRLGLTHSAAGSSA